MLQTQSVHPPTLELLKQLMVFKPLSSFNLVGGTALALQFGHRISEDIDLFSAHSFDYNELKNSISKKFGDNNIRINVARKNTLLIKINDIKVDILYYPYNLLDDLVIENKIRMVSLKDIASMKLSAVSKRGAKKDFFDIYELLQEKFTLEEMFGFYEVKFKNHELSFLARSLLYFDDAEIEPELIMIKNYNWKQVKKEITQQVNRLLSGNP